MSGNAVTDRAGPARAGRSFAASVCVLAASPALAQIEVLSLDRTMNGQARVGLETLSRSASAPTPFGLWDDFILGDVSTPLMGEAGFSVESQSEAAPGGIVFDMTAIAVARDEILDAQASATSALKLTFRTRLPTQYTLFGSRIRVASGSDSVSALLRLSSPGKPDVILLDAFSPTQLDLRLSGLLLPGTYVFEAIAAVAAVDSDTTGSVSLLDGGLVMNSQQIEPVKRWRWRTSQGGNGHIYESWRKEFGAITWEDASRIAQSLGGLLASPSTLQENQAIFENVAGDPILWVPGPMPKGPWLGGAQTAGSAEPGAGWLWISGEPFAATNWWVSKPDNAGNADRMAYTGAFTLIRPFWGDFAGNDPSIRSFIIEYPASVCPADFDGGGFVDDSDFVIFSAAYDAFACAAGPGCEGDFTGDGFVDDADFVVFTQAYDAFECLPGG